MAGSSVLKASYELMPYPKLKASLNFTADQIISQDYELVRTGQRKVRLTIFERLILILGLRYMQITSVHIALLPLLVIKCK